MNADRVRVLERRVEELTRQIAGLPVRLARAGGSRVVAAGEKFGVALAKAAEPIPPALQDGSSRLPGKGKVNIIKVSGDLSDRDWENWSLVPIPADTYLVAVAIGDDDDPVIVDAFC